MSRVIIGDPIRTTSNTNTSYSTVSHVWNEAKNISYKLSDISTILVHGVSASKFMYQTDPETDAHIREILNYCTDDLWVDYISLNCASDFETQFIAMDKIYSKSNKCFVLLEHEVVQNILELINLLKLLVLILQQDYESHEVEGVLKQILTHCGGDLGVYDTRVWTFQEHYLAKNLVYVCKDHGVNQCFADSVSLKAAYKEANSAIDLHLVDASQILIDAVASYEFVTKITSSETNMHQNIFEVLGDARKRKRFATVKEDQIYGVYKLILPDLTIPYGTKYDVAFKILATEMCRSGLIPPGSAWEVQNDNVGNWMPTGYVDVRELFLSAEVPMGLSQERETHPQLSQQMYPMSLLNGCVRPATIPYIHMETVFTTTAKNMKEFEELSELFSAWTIAEATSRVNISEEAGDLIFLQCKKRPYYKLMLRLFSLAEKSTSEFTITWIKNLLGFALRELRTYYREEIVDAMVETASNVTAEYLEKSLAFTEKVSQKRLEQFFAASGIVTISLVAENIGNYPHVAAVAHPAITEPIQYVSVPGGIDVIEVQPEDSDRILLRCSAKRLYDSLLTNKPSIVEGGLYFHNYSESHSRTWQLGKISGS
ncbi:hypothetical protein HK096_002371 [Nowakowskiella sp. JEL0078]|nr:hypothetical protein HK096_002371 [Nowakowskiella sp. JEL0078]